MCAPGGDQLSDKYVMFTHSTVSRRRDVGVGEIYLGHDGRRFLCGNICLIDIVAWFLAEEWRSRQGPLRRIHGQERGRCQGQL
jgi:hypothetical protein